MTEAQWLAATEPTVMLSHMHTVVRVAQQRGGRRKLRLFACACCRAMWQFLAEADQRRAVEVAEMFADEQCEAAELAQAKNGGWHAYCKLVKQHITEGRPQDQQKSHVLLAAHAVGWVAHKQARGAAKEGAANLRWIKTGQDQNRLMCKWLRDIFGNPFRPVAFSPEWRTSTAVALAGQMYESRDFSAMPILADALQDAGCDNEAILSHCRGSGPHVRGCWVVDLVLGKE